MSLVNGDVLVPVLLTFLIVNVILLVRFWARSSFVRQGAEVAGGRSLMPPVVAPAAPEPAAPEPPAPEPPAPEPPAPEPADGTGAAAPAELDPTEPQPASVPVGGALPSGLDDEAAWDRRVADENARLVRYRRPVTIVRLELDGLDSLIGGLGDQAGDRLVLAMTDTLRRLARDTDHIARLGPGGFGVLMPETSEAAAVRYVERVSRASAPWLESGAVRLTIGWASTAGEVGLADVQRLAAERMHRGPWRQARPAATLAYPGPATRVAARSSMTAVASEIPPSLSWQTCRDPNCNHKDDHRRDRRP